MSSRASATSGSWWRGSRTSSAAASWASTTSRARSAPSRGSIARAAPPPRRGRQLVEGIPGSSAQRLGVPRARVRGVRARAGRHGHVRTRCSTAGWSSRARTRRDPEADAISRTEALRRADVVANAGRGSSRTRVGAEPAELPLDRAGGQRSPGHEHAPGVSRGQPAPRAGRAPALAANDSHRAVVEAAGRSGHVDEGYGGRLCSSEGRPGHRCAAACSPSAARCVSLVRHERTTRGRTGRLNKWRSRRRRARHAAPPARGRPPSRTRSRSAGPSLRPGRCVARAPRCGRGRRHQRPGGRPVPHTRARPVWTKKARASARSPSTPPVRTVAPRWPQHRLPVRVGAA